MKRYLKPDVFSVVITLISLGLLVYMFLRPESVFIYSVLRSIIIMIVVYFFVQMPLYVVETEEKITIRKVMGQKEFRKGECVITKLSNDDMLGSVRLFGSGGLFGYIGWFRNDKLGKFYMLSLSRRQLLKIVEPSGKVFVVGCPQWF